jgi:hypothetical protein
VSGLQQVRFAAMYSHRWDEGVEGWPFPHRGFSSPFTSLTPHTSCEELLAIRL